MLDSILIVNGVLFILFETQRLRMKEGAPLKLTRLHT